jgi:hypothetical protein
MAAAAHRQLNGAKFPRQHPIEGFIVDFFCLDARLVIELDSSQHWEEPERQADERRTEYRAIQSHRVLVSVTRRSRQTSMVCSKPLPSFFNYKVPHPRGKGCRATSPDGERHNFTEGLIRPTLRTPRRCSTS